MEYNSSAFRGSNCTIATYYFRVTFKFVNLFFEVPLKVLGARQVSFVF